MEVVTMQSATAAYIVLDAQLYRLRTKTKMEKSDAGVVFYAHYLARF